MVLSILQKTRSLRIAQLYINYSSIPSTAFYNQNLFSNKQQKEISEFLTNTNMSNEIDNFSFAVNEATKLLDGQVG